MRGGRVQGAGSGRSPAACGGESRLRLLCSGEAGTGCALVCGLQGAGVRGRKQRAGVWESGGLWNGHKGAKSR